MNSVGTRYTRPIDAFLDLVIGMNNGVRAQRFVFAEVSKTCDRSRKFAGMLESVTRRRLDIQHETNCVEVRIL